MFLLLCLMYSYCMFIYLHLASWHSLATLTEVFPFFFLSCKGNAREKPAKTGQGPHSSKIFVLFCVLFVLCRFVSFCVSVCVCVCVCVCKCVLYYCHPIAVNNYIISYRIILYIFRLMTVTSIRLTTKM